MLHTEYEFTLPVGIVGADGELHRQGTMRLATARDEIEPLRDPKVRENEAYLTVLLLSRVIIQLSGVERVTPAVVEELYAADFDHLQRLYERINCDPDTIATVTCPSCAADIDVDLRPVEDAWLSK
ncbi:MAG TPA: hypothetical protein VG388_14420 [Solirubrobacteraceae bacterium]|jgi:hypothetical protein|nr:hypothetical protein [Solirubrobacteraceae bacterium]